ncbi:MAG: translation initiation factor IF-2 subunit alpha [Candidatus Thorarchaeota archaeon]|nr:MAG: translation initiation factor IF-2 subunit alpha [Candidatus Thorarchaeota archaeon]RLI59697.1 MAG: translation initiation factor IF-2 subunit alpha [Candidatus Thorarchaeota archaeon]
MVLKRAEWPQPDDYAIAVATKVAPYGAYVTLPEYGNKEGFIHISEISSTWVRNIRNHIHEKQRVVVKVLKVDPDKGHIDCSLRRVSTEAKRAKNNEWKRAQKAEKLLELVAKESDMTLEEVYEKIGWPIEDVFGEIYTGLEKAADAGPEVFDNVQATKTLRKKVADLAKQRIEIPSVEIDGEMTITVPGPNGVEVIKNALVEGLERGKAHDKSTTEIYALGSPRYKLRIVSPDYKEAEEVLSDVLGHITKTIESGSGSITFSRK